MKTSRIQSGAIKLIPILLVALFLLLALWAVQGFRTAEAPGRSTTESRPNSTQNVPDGPNGSVTEGRNPNRDTVPSPTGTGANNLLEESR